MRNAGNVDVDELFAMAVALDGEERSKYLVSRCGPDEMLRCELEELLRCYDAAGEFLEVPPLTSVAMAELPRVDRESTPVRIGRFRVVRVLGVGGMGRVYLAESEQPKRLVALKVIRGGLGSESLRRRFEQEAQVIALLQHPGIAQLYEAGTADEGDGPQPYFAMEYVDGPTLTEYAKRHVLSTRDRLELVCRVCEAVDHAHHRGVVHRDLKPGNVLVDETGQPKILDFGVARLVDPITGNGLAGNTLHTQAGQLIGTLSYMSPEQVGGAAGTVDARSDVYSLGVVLFELLTGRLPHDVRSCSIAEAIRAIREEPPTTLSTIDRGYRGDIDTIVGKALSKEASRRYQSAAELAADIRRSLRDEPIVARPPSAVYQLAKFAKRNKTLVGGVAATIIALSAGLVAAIWQAQEAETARVEAVSREEEARGARAAAIKAQQAAEKNLETTNEINRFLGQLLSSPDPDARLGRDVTVMEVIDRSARHLDGALTDQPHVKAVMHRTIGNTYRNLDDYEKAEAHLRAAYAMHVELFGEENIETITSATSLVQLLSDQGKHNESLALAKRQWELAQVVLDVDDPERMSMGSNYASALLDVGDWKAAERLQRFVLTERMRVLPPDHDHVLSTRTNLGRMLARTGRLQEAAAIQREVVDAYRKSGAPMTSVSFGAILALANTLLELRQHEEAGALATELIHEGAELFAPDQNAMLSARNVLGQLMLDEGRFAEAEQMFRDLIEAHRRSQVPAADGLSRIMNNLGTALRQQNRLAEAEAAYREAIEILDRGKEVPDRVRIGALNNLATVLRLKGDHAAATPIYKELVEVSENVLPPNDLTIAVSKYGYGITMLAAKNPVEAEAQFQGAYDIAMKNFTEKDEPVITIMRSFVNLYTLWKKPEKAAFWREKLPEKYRKD